MDLTSMPAVGHPYLHFKGHVYKTLGFCRTEYNGVPDVLHVIYCDFIKNLTATTNLSFHTENLSAYRLAKSSDSPSDFYQATTKIEQETSLTKYYKATFQHTWMRPLESFTNILEDGTPRFKPCLYSREYWRDYHIKNHSASFGYRNHTYEEFSIVDENEKVGSDNYNLQVLLNNFREVYKKYGSGRYGYYKGNFIFLSRKILESLGSDEKLRSAEVYACYLENYFDHLSEKNEHAPINIPTVKILEFFKQVEAFDSTILEKHIAQIKFIQNYFGYGITVDESRKITYNDRQSVIDSLSKEVLKYLQRSYKILL